MFTANMIGLRFGKLEVLGRGPTKVSVAGKYYAQWVCRCDCGVEVIVKGQRLRGGKRKSCGGLGCREFRGGVKRGGSTVDYPTEYNVWEGMRSRCYRVADDHYRYYGGRGIKVCERWGDFKNFLADMGRRPAGWTIERIDVDGDYEPGNCKWIPAVDQARNTRRTQYVEYGGKRWLLIDLCKELGVNRGVVYGRLKQGWLLEDALRIPVGRIGSYKNRHEWLAGSEWRYGAKR